MSLQPEVRRETIVAMPSVVDSMSEGVVGRWLKRDGERVEQNEELVELETDKATVAYESPEAGYLEIVVSEGTTVAVGEVIARLTSEPHAAGAAEPAPQPPAPVAAERVEQEVQAVDAAPEPADDVRATPLARLLAKRHGVSLDSIGGSGPRGRVTRNDVASAFGLAISPPPRATENGSAVPPREGTVQGISRVQNTIARRMSESHATVPDFQVETEVVMDAAVALREELKALGGETPSLNDFVIRASALALREHPRANSSFQEGSFVLFPQVNVGMAVAIDDALLVPVVTDADVRSLVEVAAETRRLGESARTGTIPPAELAGATFTVSNLGMFGMTAITPIIDLPQAAILGVGAIRTTLALDEGTVVERRLMTLRLTCDHRILYGADAARFLSTIRTLLEQPLRLLL